MNDQTSYQTIYNAIVRDNKRTFPLEEFKKAFKEAGCTFKKNRKGNLLTLEKGIFVETFDLSQKKGLTQVNIHPGTNIDFLVRLRDCPTFFSNV